MCSLVFHWEKTLNPSQYERHSTVSTNYVFKKMSEGFKRATFNGNDVWLDSNRMKTFHLKGLVCASCGLKATKFAIERDRKRPKGIDTYHLNLYSDCDTLFTHDHILARAEGGEDNLDNTQTMCRPCNNRKSIDERKRVEEKRRSQDGGLLV